MPELCNFHSIPNTIGGGSREVSINTKYRNDYTLWSNWYTNYGQYDCSNNKFTSFWKWMFKNYSKDTRVNGILNILDTCTFDDEIEINLYENDNFIGYEFKDCSINKVIVTKRYNDDKGYSINKNIHGLRVTNVNINELVLNMILSKNVSTIGNNFIYGIIVGENNNYLPNISFNINLITLSSGSKGSLIQTDSRKLPKNINIDIGDVYNFDIDDDTVDTDLQISIYRITNTITDSITYIDDDRECNIYFTFYHIFSNTTRLGLFDYNGNKLGLLDLNTYSNTIDLSNGIIRFYLSFQVNSNIQVYLPTDTSDYNYEVYLDFKNGATCTFTNTSKASPGSVHILNCPASIATNYTDPCFVIENQIGLTVGNIIANKYLMAGSSEK